MKWMTGHRSISPLLAAFAAVSLGAIMGWWAFPPVAHASSCVMIHYFTDASDHNIQFAHWGTRVTSPGMYAYDDSGYTPCDRDSSILSEDSAGDGAEIGWHILASGYQTCNTTGDGTAHAYWVQVVGTTYICHEYGAAGTLSGYYNMSVRMESTNPGTWVYTFQSVVLDTPYIGFAGSASLTNAERHTTGDSAHALFSGLQFRASSDDTWKDWGSSACVPSPPGNVDPDWKNQLLSATEVTVKLNTEIC